MFLSPEKIATAAFVTGWNKKNVMIFQVALNKAHLILIVSERIE